MIIGERKSFEEIWNSVKDLESVWSWAAVPV
jgi:hypothetical protein